ncbi:MAG: diguanylate cyclase [Thermoleophilia bacterium]
MASTDRRIGMSGAGPDDEVLRAFRAAGLETGHLIVAVTDPEGVVTEVGGGWEDLVGRPRDRIVGRLWYAVLHPADRERVREALEAAGTPRPGSPPVCISARVERDDGLPRWLSARLLPRHAPGGTFAGHLLSGTDVTAPHESALRIERMAAEQSALRRLATSVAAGARPDETCALAAELAADLIGGCGGSVVRFDGDAAVPVGRWGDQRHLDAAFPARASPEGDGALSRVRRTDSATRVDAVGDPTCADGGRAGPTGAVAAPIHVSGALWGAVAVARADAVPFSPAAEERLERFAELCGLAISNAEARDELRAQAMTDPLSGLANRRVLVERLRAAIAHAARTRRPVTLALIDLDGLKSVNDAWGHDAGDRAIVSIATILRGHSRPQDTAARMGGDEFAWVLVDAGLDGAVGAIERVRAELAAVATPGAPLSMSAGACQAHPATGVRGLMALADDALYRAKSAGRGTTRVTRAARP